MAAILIWGCITLLLFLVAASNDQLHTMHWRVRLPFWLQPGARDATEELLSACAAAAHPNQPSSAPHPTPRRWPHAKAFTDKGFESAVQMVGVLPILVVAFLCQSTLTHTVSAAAVL